MSRKVVAVVAAFLAGAAAFWLAGLALDGEGPVAKRDLSVNHLVLKEDLEGAGLKTDEFTSKYLKRPVAAGTPIDAGMLASSPTLLPKPGLPWVGLPIETSNFRVGNGNAGSLVRICAGDSHLGSAARVGAVLCEKADATTCTAFVRVTGRAMTAMAAHAEFLSLKLAPSCDEAAADDEEAEGDGDAVAAGEDGPADTEETPAAGGAGKSK